VRLLGYTLTDSADPSRIYLVFEFLERGSLDKHLETEICRKNLTGYHRVQILFEVARSLQFLHHGGAGGHKFCHRDVKPENIGLASDDRAKLMDCGLAKFIDDDNDGAQGIPSGILITAGKRVTGTVGYKCPVYCQGKIDKYEEACDVFSFGVVMLEVITGSRQIGHPCDRKFGPAVDLVERYEGNQTLLEDEQDPVVKSEWRDVIGNLSSLALRCTTAWKLGNRPSTEIIMKELNAVSATMEGRQREVEQDSDESMESKQQCRLCAKQDHRGMECTLGHFACRMCLERHVCCHAKNKSKHPMFCPITSCASEEFTCERLQRSLSEATLEHVRLAKMTPVNRLTAKLARLGGDNSPSCPRLIWIVPRQGNESGTNWASCASNAPTSLYFVCQHSFTCVEQPRVVEPGWVASMAAEITLCAELLEAAFAEGKIQSTMPFPKPGIEVTQQLQAFGKFAKNLHEAASLVYMGTAGESGYGSLTGNAVLVEVFDDNDSRIHVKSEFSRLYTKGRKRSRPLSNDF
jgi:serine/threonine protein kinase